MYLACIYATNDIPSLLEYCITALLYLSQILNKIVSEVITRKNEDTTELH